MSFTSDQCVSFDHQKHDPSALLKLIGLWERETCKDFDKELAHMMGDQLPDKDLKALEFDMQKDLIPSDRVAPSSGIKSLGK